MLLIMATLFASMQTAFSGAGSDVPLLRQDMTQAGEKAPVKTWANSGEMQLSYAAARTRVISKYEGAGFKLKHEIPMGKRNTRCLMLWEKGDVKTVVMLWKIDIGRTGFSTGEMRDDNK
ncbi:MAG: hypothetical protein MJ202_07535 [Lentisphaeria bacterium]|nr:hypothetical protein [Lentisphaeria bacterium]